MKKLTPLQEAIIENLKEKKTTYQIAKEIKTSWGAANTNLWILKALDLVDFAEENTSRHKRIWFK